MNLFFYPLSFFLNKKKMANPDKFAPLDKYFRLAECVVCMNVSVVLGPAVINLLDLCGMVSIRKLE